MKYLEFKEYEELGGKATNKRFVSFYPKASVLLDNVTDYRYIKNDLTKDIDFRKNRFKMALVAHINYFDEMDADTFESLNKMPQTIQIGSTTVSNGSRYNAAGANESKPLVPDDVYICLEGTGLLYRGVDSC